MANSLGDLIVKIGADISDYVNQLGKAQRQIAALGSQLETVGARMSVAITAPMVGLGVAALKTAGQFEQNQIAFKTMLGSADQAKGMLQELSTLAASSPFELQDTVTGARRLLAMGTAAKDVVPTMRTIGNAVSALGSGSQGLERVSVALGQMGAKGKATGEEMRQLTEAGIKGWDYLAKAIGTTVPEAMKQSEKGLISSKVAIKAILDGIEKDFAGAMEAQNKTFLGQMSNLKDNITRTLGQIGEVLMPTAKAVVEMMQPMLAQAVELARAFAALPPWVQGTAIAFLGLAAAAGPVLFVFGALIKSVGEVLGVFKLIGGSGGIAAGVATSIKSIGSAAVLAAAAFAGWKLGEWARNNLPIVKQLGDALADGFVDVWRSITGGSRNSIDAMNALDVRMAALAARLKEKGIIVERGTMTAGEYSSALLKAAAATGVHGQAAIAASTQVAVMGTEHEKTAKKVKNFSEAILRAQLERVVALEAEGNHAAIAARKLATFYDQMINGAAAAADLSDGLKLTVPALLDVNAAFAALGVTSVASMQHAADVAEDAYKTILASGTATARDVLAAWIAMTEAVQRASLAAGKEILAVDRIALDDAKRTLDQMDGKVATTTASVQRNTSRAMQAVSTVVTDLSRGIADAILHAKSLGDVFEKVADDILTAILRNIIEKGLNKLIDKLATIGGMWGKLGGIMGGGGSGGGSGVSIPGVGGAGGGAGSAIGAAAGAGVAGVVGAVAGVVGAVSSIIGNFQMKAMNKSLDLIEANTRFTQIGIIGPGGMLDRMNTYLPGLVGVQDRLVDVRGALFVPVASTLEGIYDRLGGGGAGKAGASMTFNFYGVTDARQMAEKIVVSMKQAGVKV